MRVVGGGHDCELHRLLVRGAGVGGQREEQRHISLVPEGGARDLEREGSGAGGVGESEMRIMNRQCGGMRES